MHHPWFPTALLKESNCEIFVYFYILYQLGCQLSVDFKYFSRKPINLNLCELFLKTITYKVDKVNDAVFWCLMQNISK